MKFYRIIIFIAMFNSVFSMCGGCPEDAKVQSIEADKKVNVSALITSVPENGYIEGLVIASCGKCNFGLKKERRCSLSIKINDQFYSVEGASVHGKGNAHGKEGMCSVIRVASVLGIIKNNIFYAEIFDLITS